MRQPAERGEQIVIVVISHTADPHAARVIGHLQASGQAALLFDLAEMPDRAALSIDYADPARPHIHYRRTDGTLVALHEASAVWWRRPQVPDLSSIADPQMHLFAANEWNEAINGLWQLLLDARWMNNPIADDAASRKARQLRVAAEVGLSVPRTLITSDPEQARAFVTALGTTPAVYKTFSCTHAVWRETRLLCTGDLAQLPAVRVAPVIFQEFVPAEADLRVTVVGEQVFAAAIRSRPRNGSIDFRSSVGEASVTPEELPTDLISRLLALMRRLGLVYGAIDLRRTPAGTYCFFEVNTAGEFLFIEERTGQPIAQAVAMWLAGISRSA